MEYDASLDCWIVMYRLPDHVDALVRETADGTVVVLINDQLSLLGRKRAFEHERKHILRGDLHSDLTASEIEGTI